MTASGGRTATHRPERRVEPERALQIGFLLLLAVCAAQVVWWIFDEIEFTTRVERQVLEHHARDAEAARRLLERGMPRDDVIALFDDLVIAEDGTVSIAPEAEARLHETRRSRINRYAWEGSFFLLVLLAGVAVLARAMRQDAALRRRQQNFVAAVSHEFKSPVASMRLAAETLLDRDPPEEMRRRIVRRLVQDIDRLESMVVNILDAARIEEGALPRMPERIPVAEMAKAVVDEARVRAEEAGVELVCDVPDDLVVEADRSAMHSVLRNLLDNALKAAESGAGSTVRIEAARDGAMVRVSVVDDGVGFDPAEGPNLFLKFYRPGDELQRRSRGSGLGLYLVRRFVELDGGRVEAASDGPGRGARFTVHWRAAEGR
ncbi:MAG: hypothetical protein Kow0062_19300 [Acidobacteriota bacterium]